MLSWSDLSMMKTERAIDIKQTIITHVALMHHFKKQLNSLFQVPLRAKLRDR